MDAQKSASDIFLDYNFKPAEVPKAVVNWAYGLKVYPKELTKICPKTFRPLSVYDNKPWEETV